MWSFGGCRQNDHTGSGGYKACVYLMTHCGYDTPRIVLLQKSQKLSVKQLITYHTACQTFRIKTSKYPTYHHRKLFSNEFDNLPGTRSQQNHYCNNIGYKLSLSRNQFFYQASQIWNTLPVYLKKMEKIETFKKHLKIWVKTNIRPF